jgi:hypothetical protein
MEKDQTIFDLLESFEGKPKKYKGENGKLRSG